MRRFYRNRHATFIKTMLEKKNKAKEDEEERKLAEEKKKQKVKEKALARLQEQATMEKVVVQEPIHEGKC